MKLNVAMLVVALFGSVAQAAAPERVDVSGSFSWNRTQNPTQFEGTLTLESERAKESTFAGAVVVTDTYSRAGRHVELITLTLKKKRSGAIARFAYYEDVGTAWNEEFAFGFPLTELLPPSGKELKGEVSMGYWDDGVFDSGPSWSPDGWGNAVLTLRY